MDSISSTNSLVTQVFDSGSDKNVIDHYRYIHPRNMIPSAIEVQHNKTTAVVTPSTKRRLSFEQSETEATKKQNHKSFATRRSTSITTVEPRLLFATGGHN